MTLLPLIALALLQGGLPQQGAPATPPAHLFILSGQSNMRGLDPAISFTPAVEGAFGSESVIVVKDAQGGAPLHRWCEDWVMEGVETPDGRGELYQRLMGKMRPAIEGREIESVTFVWMQGERDARMQFGDVYRASLERVVGQLSRDLGRDDLACVVGRLSDFDLVDERYPHWTRIRRALVEFAEASPRRAWVDTDDLNDGFNGRGKPIENSLHYSVSGYRTLGERLAREAIRLVQRAPRPHIVLVMADDQGWGDAGYAGHPFVQTPALDAMADAGLVLERFYAAAPVCSPTRASVLTGRSPIRTKVTNHGRYMRPHEWTLAEALKEAGYVTGLFGKLHVGSVQPDSPCNPSGMGFDEWVAGLNFFDRDPYLSRNGAIEQREGQGTVITMDEALAFLRRHHGNGEPMFTVIWFPSPHDPHVESPGGAPLYEGEKHAGYYREITLLDRQVGRLRSELRKLGLADNTLLWYCSDNGGLVSETAGGRGRKGSVYEGGLRVPSIVEWPAAGLEGRIATPLWTCDMLPTILRLAGAQRTSPHPLDGEDVLSALRGQRVRRGRPLGFWHGLQGGQSTWSDRIQKVIFEKQQAGDPPPSDPGRMQKDVDEFPQFPEATAKGHAAWLDWPWKLHRIEGENYELYHLGNDPDESRDLSRAPEHESQLKRMKAQLQPWMRDVIGSLNGDDYH